MVDGRCLIVKLISRTTSLLALLLSILGSGYSRTHYNRDNELVTSQFTDALAEIGDCLKTLNSTLGSALNYSETKEPTDLAA